jgi:hypothetical protein
MADAASVLAQLRVGVTRIHGDDADLSLIEACDPALIVALESQQRVKVCDARGNYERTGKVSRSVGPRPVLLLMHRSGDVGSSDVLCAHDRVTAWWDGNRYAEET